jgi:hypothetical protein
MRTVALAALTAFLAVAKIRLMKQYCPVRGLRKQ